MLAGYLKQSPRSKPHPNHHRHNDRQHLHLHPLDRSRRHPKRHLNSSTPTPRTKDNLKPSSGRDRKRRTPIIIRIRISIRTHSLRLLGIIIRPTFLRGIVFPYTAVFCFIFLCAGGETGVEILILREFFLAFGRFIDEESEGHQELTCLGVILVSKGRGSLADVPRKSALVLYGLNGTGARS